MYSQLLVLWWGETSKTLVIGGDFCGDIEKDLRKGEVSSSVKSGQTEKSDSSSQLFKAGNECNAISKDSRGGKIRSPRGQVGIKAGSRGGAIRGNKCKR